MAQAERMSIQPLSIVLLAGFLSMTGCGRDDGATVPPPQEAVQRPPAAPTPVEPRPTPDDRPVEDESGLPRALVGEWLVVSIGGEAITDTPSGNGVRRSGGHPTLRLEPNGQASGSGGINRWSSTLTVLDGATGAGQFASIASTMMAGPPELMDVESAFLRALGEARSFDATLLGQGELVFRDEAGQETVRLRRAE